MMLQLNPALPFWHVPTRQACEAFLAIDYGIDHDLMLAVILKDGRIFVCRTPDLCGVENQTIGRPGQSPATQTAIVVSDADRQEIRLMAQEGKTLAFIEDLMLVRGKRIPLPLLREIANGR
jgi:hypothetical protein